jgi:PadR family transcriptional regulator, regulatory protein PadR
VGILLRAAGISRVATYTGIVGHGAKPLGDVDTSILAVLADGDLHGYAILAEVRELSDGGVRLGTGTMYGALERLQDNGMVRVAAEDVVDGRTRRYYRLTDAGRHALVAELERRDQLVNAARRRLAGAT